MILFICHRDHEALQRLTHLDVHLTSQGKDHRADALCQVHTPLQRLVDLTAVRLGEVRQMH